jgi:hypothetical protein
LLLSSHFAFAISASHFAVGSLRASFSVVRMRQSRDSQDVWKKRAVPEFLRLKRNFQRWRVKRLVRALRDGLSRMGLLVARGIARLI